MFRKWSRWGLFDFNTRTKPHPICYAVAFDPDGWKRARDDMVQEAGIELRLHSWFAGAHRRGRPHRRRRRARARKAAQAIMGDVVIDATGDLDVAASAGARVHPTAPTWSRPCSASAASTPTRPSGSSSRSRSASTRSTCEARRVIGGSWDYWWLKTPLPGIVWCNCPHMTGLDGMKVDDLTRAEFEGRRRIHAMVEHVRAKLPGFANCYVVDVAPQTGVRQTRLLEGEYVVTKEDVTPAACISPTASRAAATTTRRIARCCRARRPASRRRPALFRDPAGAEDLARDPALHGDGRGGRHRRGDGAVGRQRRCATSMSASCSARLRAQGADPGDQPPANARVSEHAA